MEKEIRSTALLLVEELLFEFFQLVEYLNAKAVTGGFELRQSRCVVRIGSMPSKSQMRKYLIIIRS